jgi:head-tail adaptor
MAWRAGSRNRLVTLWKGPEETNDADGYEEALDPSTWWATIEPLSPIASDETRMQASRVTMRYHPQVTLDCFIKIGTRKLLVRGVQNIDDANRELVLFCTEAMP